MLQKSHYYGKIGNCFSQEALIYSKTTDSIHEQISTAVVDRLF